MSQGFFFARFIMENAKWNYIKGNGDGVVSRY